VGRRKTTAPVGLSDAPTLADVAALQKEPVRAVLRNPLVPESVKALLSPGRISADARAASRAAVVAKVMGEGKVEAKEARRALDPEDMDFLEKVFGAATAKLIHFVLDGVTLPNGSHLEGPRAYWKTLVAAEIAKLLGISEGTVSQAKRSKRVNDYIFNALYGDQSDNYLQIIDSLATLAKGGSVNAAKIVLAETSDRHLLRKRAIKGNIRDIGDYEGLTEKQLDAQIQAMSEDLGIVNQPALSPPVVSPAEHVAIPEPVDPFAFDEDDDEPEDEADDG